MGFKQLSRYHASAAGLSFLMVGLVLTLGFTQSAQGEQFASPDFQKVWTRTDQQVLNTAISRTYLWGPASFTSGLQEEYQEAPGGKRLVQYFDKSRMEINNPAGDKTSPFYVTNGLLARELMSGRMQLGDNKFVELAAAEIPVAGDPDDTSGPTYRTLNPFSPAAPNTSGQPIKNALNRAGNVRDAKAEFGKYGIKNVQFVSETGHNIAQPFWDFLNLSGPILDKNGKVSTGRIFEPIFYATGLPVTDAYWARVKVAGEVKDVLVQAFERRVLTYTPSNPAGFQVEMGNVGRHYYDWRYNQQVARACEGVPEAQNASLRPAKCVNPGSPIALEIRGFKGGEPVTYWLTAPDGKMLGEQRTLAIPPSGSLEEVLDTDKLSEGSWYWTFEGQQSKNQAIIYFKIQPGSQVFVGCADVPEGKDGLVRPAKCVPTGTPVLFSVSGFAPDENLVFWLSGPDGNQLGAKQSSQAGPSGSLDDLTFDTLRYTPGIWTWTFESTASKKQAVVYIGVRQP